MKLESGALLDSPLGSADGGCIARSLPYLLLVALLVWSLGWYWMTAVSMESTWAQSSTFQHGYTIVPISMALIWGRRRQLQQIPLAPVFWPLILLAPLGIGWLLADLAEVVVIRQYALVLMAPVLVAALLGIRFMWAIVFPLAFLVLAVPFGEFLLPPMIDFTADFTVSALRITGIPVFREGPNFSLPSGNWSVVEACSGLRYLIASFTLGCLYAYLNYRSLKYRLVFIALSLLVPILANGLRAYLIVILGHISNMQLAVGVDHYIYGWLFFGVVIGLLFWAGSFWREDGDIAPEWAPEEQETIQRRPPYLKMLCVTVVGAALVAIWPAYAAYLIPPSSSTVRLEVLDVPGWKRTDYRLSNWRPHFVAPRAQIDEVFEKDGHQIGIYIGYYNNQNPLVKLISASNALTVTAVESWSTVSNDNLNLSFGEKDTVVVHQSMVRGPHARFLAWHWFWVEGEHTGSAYLTKMLQAKSRLLNRGDDSAIVVLYTPADSHTSTAEATLKEFFRDALPAIEKTLDGANHG